MKPLFRLFLVLLLSVPLLATTVVPRSVEELAARSSNVVLGKAVRTWSNWDPQQKLIFTYTEFAVERSLKGSAPARITVKQLGGKANGITQKVAGVRHLRAGEQAVLFLKPSAQAGTMSVTALMQGHFRVTQSSTGEAVVSNGIAGVSKLDRTSGAVSEFKGRSMTLRQLEERIRTVTK